jgi:hypothetical protein
MVLSQSQMGRGLTFMNAHTIHGQVEEPVFTGVRDCIGSSGQDELVTRKELENAKANPELVVPELDFVIQGWWVSPVLESPSP